MCLSRLCIAVAMAILVSPVLDIDVLSTQQKYALGDRLYEMFSWLMFPYCLLRIGLSSEICLALSLYYEFI